MKVCYAFTKKDKKKFKKFRMNLYKNDPFYVSTVEFTCDMLLYKTTTFAASCNIKPVMIIEDEILCEALLIKAPKDDFVQISFFEAIENADEAVNLLIEEAKKFAISAGVKKIIIGLNGHLSYGVGLSVDMNKPNTFDSTYTKTYYNKYFEKYTKYDLVAFSNSISNMINTIPKKESNIVIRPINLKKFKEEIEEFRKVCNETIGKTFLYAPTEKLHFEELLEDMLFFLKPENILMAYDNNELVGFIFWHPDYNEILKKGKYNSLLSIALRYTLFKNKIKKIKLNAIGVKEKYQGIVTMNLLREVTKYCHCDELETNFVWCNNFKSMRLNKHIVKNIERQFAVYEVIV
jgi:hypothetical protein